MIQITFLNNFNAYNKHSKFATKYNLDLKYEKDKLYKEICNIFNSLNNNSKLEDFLFKFNKFSKEYQLNKQIKTEEIDVNILISLYDNHFLFNVESYPDRKLIESKRYIKNKLEGNCVDNFITKVLESNLYSINNFIEDIKTRQNIRTNTKEYHQTACYEHDFSQLITIRDILNKMINSCDKQLTQMSDKYTKIE